MSRRPAGVRGYLDQALRYECRLSAATKQSDALEAAINAAESYLEALRLTDSPEEKRRLDSKCKELISLAERIKHGAAWTEKRADRGAPVLKEPVSRRKLFTREEIILLESAKLNGFIFPPWTDPPNCEEFELSKDGQLFLDQPDLSLSPSQKRVFDGWKRPDELLSVANSESSSTGPTMVNSKPMDLVQAITTDCSVVASLCAAAAREERGHHKLFSSTIYPYDKVNNMPRLSSSGKYIFKFYFNGCYRKVVIDDRLPSASDSRSLYVVDRNNPNLLWPALIEKAYLKVRGGYDFPGSNSGTDLWVLTGWIPEQIFIHHEDVTPDQIWKRLFNSFRYGDVIVTVGTGKLTEREEQLVGLISQHDYAVLDMVEVDGRRRMLIKNPWAEKAHVGPFGLDEETMNTSPESSSRGPLTPGTFWMDCDQVFQNFENLYLNWNPGLFRFREDFHFTWDLSKPRMSSCCYLENPQFAVSSESGGPVWLLLSRHFRTTERPATGHSEDDRSPELGFISINVFKNGHRVSVGDGAIYRGPYVDSPNTLARIDMPPRSTYTIVITQQSLLNVSHNFSLSALSRSEVSLACAHDRYAYKIQVDGEWSPATAGGNAESPRYPSNPQFSLQLEEEADLSIVLEISDPELAVHVKLFWSNGKRVGTVRRRDIVTDSGDYRRGCVVAAKDHVARGLYTIVCSTFAPDQVAKFRLWVSSTRQCHVKALPSEAAGRLPVLSTIGVLSPGTDRIRAPLRVPRLTRVKFIARSRDAQIANRTVTPSPMLMTIELGQGPYKQVIGTSEEGEYSDAMAGIRVDDIDLRPEDEQKGGIWIVIERIGGPEGQVTDYVDVEALGEERVEIGEWIS